MVLYYGGRKTDRNALIAQLDRASGYGPEGREFESSSARQSSASTRRRVVEALVFLQFSVSRRKRVYLFN